MKYSKKTLRKFYKKKKSEKYFLIKNKKEKLKETNTRKLKAHKNKKKFLLNSKNIKNKLRNPLIFKLLIILLFLFILFQYKYNVLKSKSKFYFFEKNENELNNCEKYSIFIYKYEYTPPNSNLEVNIGDYIQSLAALQFLPKNCKPNLMDRDKIEYYNGPQTTLIMNCWLRLFNGTRTISDKISPIITSLHISNVKKIDLRTKNILKKFSPIGCRDYYTLNALKKNGIDAYFSSCLTTTLDIDYSVSDSERTNDIIFADYNFNYDRRIKEYLNSLKIYNFSNVTKTYHIFKENIFL